MRTMENIFSKMETSSGNVPEMDDKTPLEYHPMKTEMLENQKSQLQRPVTTEEALMKDEGGDIQQRSDSDDNEDANLDQAGVGLEDMLTKTEDFMSTSETVRDTKQNITQSLQGTSFESDIILPKPAPSENKKEKKREIKSRKELEEEEREKMQYVLNICDLQYSLCITYVKQFLAFCLLVCFISV